MITKVRSVLIEEALPPGASVFPGGLGFGVPGSLPPAGSVTDDAVVPTFCVFGASIRS